MKNPPKFSIIRSRHSLLFLIIFFSTSSLFQLLSLVGIEREPKSTPEEETKKVDDTNADPSDVVEPEEA